MIMFDDVHLIIVPCIILRTENEWLTRLNKSIIDFGKRCQIEDGYIEYFDGIVLLI